MTLHRPLANHIVTLLRKSIVEGQSLERTLNHHFRVNRKLGSRDRRFVAETLYELIRWRRLVWTAIGLGQNDIPNVNDIHLWHALGAWLLAGKKSPVAELPDWPEFKGLSQTSLARAFALARTTPAVAESVPDWLYLRGEKELGKKWPEELCRLNEAAPVVLRANRLKIHRQELSAVLEKEGVETHFAPAVEDGLVLQKRQKVTVTEAFRRGLFEVQDGASQQVAPFLKLQPGQTVIDACAGAGGKTLHICALLQNKGQVLAMDTEERRLERLLGRAARAGAKNIQVRTVDLLSSIDDLHCSADRLLLDVPCSGSGVWRRKPETKWTITPKRLERLITLQSNLLIKYSTMLKPTGRMVYATCSVFTSENQDQVRAFLETAPGDWELTDERRLPPGENGYDGFYMAALTRRH